MENKSKETMDFFSDVVTGKSEIFKPIKPWEPIIPIKEKWLPAIGAYTARAGLFDEHIATSIPTFREAQFATISSLAEILPDNSLVYDIGGSEGTWLKTLCELRDGTVMGIVLDPNKDMEASFYRTPAHGCSFIAEAFCEGFDEYPRHVPKEKADVVHESMTFQFISNEREAFIREVAEHYLKKDGLFLTEEKFVWTDMRRTLAQEKQKDEYKKMYYLPEQITQKSDEILVGMLQNQVRVAKYYMLLSRYFHEVEPYWDAGNFMGFVCSNSFDAIARFRDSIGLISSKYSSFNTILL